jgi:LPS sulfotransferase NodH
VKRDAVRFVIFAAPRTGSNLLCSLLNAHPDILCHHGLFNPGGVHWARDRPGNGDSAARDHNVVAFLDSVWAIGGDAGAIGFKMNRDENDEAADALLSDPGIRKILLKRRNRVRTYVSEEIARLTGIWESYDEPGETAIPALRIEADDLIRHTALNAAYYAGLESSLRATGQGWLETNYEALADRSEIARILAFLGIAARSALPAASYKRGPADLGAVVENFDELAGVLQGTALLDDLFRGDAPELHCHLFTPEEQY